MRTSAEQRLIAIPWLARLRWIAVLGQAVATAISLRWLELQQLLPAIAVVVSITAATNLILQFRPTWIGTRIIPAIIVLDVLLFSVLLGLTGGPNNPFCALYVIHAAMAVVVLGTGWAWAIITLCAICYCAIALLHFPFAPLPVSVLFAGNAIAILITAGLIAYFTGRVMRELGRREAELSEAREAARHTEHLAALTTLAAGAAHELGTPLSTIALVAKELERAESSSVPEDAKLIRHEVERCRQILDRMRVDVIEDAQHRPAQETLKTLIEQLRDDLRPDESARLAIEATAPLDSILSQARVLRRAVGVLLRNAFDASQPGASVSLLFSFDKNDMIFRVVDCGSGMSAEVIRRAGEPFFTTKPAGEGMGLGLYLVRLAARTYGGRFELTSTLGVGTQSLLALPDLSGAGRLHG